MEKYMEMQAFVGEEEVMKMNAELAARRDFTVEDIENLPEGVRAELIDGRMFSLQVQRRFTRGYQENCLIESVIISRKMLGHVRCIMHHLQLGCKTMARTILNPILL